MTSSDRPFVDRMEEAGRDAANRAQELMARGNARQVILRDAHGGPLVQLPLPIALAIAVLCVFTAPWLAGLGALVALLTGCRLQIVHREPPLIP